MKRHRISFCGGDILDINAITNLTSRNIKTMQKNSTTSKTSIDTLDLKSQFDPSKLTIPELLDYLKEKYPSVSIEIGTLPSQTSIKDYALQAGGGTHLLISNEFLEQLQKDETTMKKGFFELCNILDQVQKKAQHTMAMGKPVLGAGAVITDSSQVSYWTSTYEYRYDYAEDLKKRREEKKQEEAVQEKKKIQYDPQAMIARVLSAKTSVMAKTLKSKAYGNLYYLEGLKRSSSYDKTELKRLIAHAKNIVFSVKGKIKNLEQEEHMQKKVKEAEQEQRQKEAQLLRQAMENARRKHRLGEYHKLKSTNIHFLTDAEKRRYLRSLGIPLSSPSPSILSSVSSPSISVSTGGSMQTNVQVNVSTSLDISI